MRKRARYPHATTRSQLDGASEAGRNPASWYRSRSAGARDDQIAGEATPSYMTHEAYIKRVAATLPGVRAIALLRNPVDRAWSQYRYVVARGEESRSFEDVLAVERRLEPDDWRASGMCLARGRYVNQLRKPRSAARP